MFTSKKICLYTENHLTLKQYSFSYAIADLEPVHKERGDAMRIFGVCPKSQIQFPEPQTR